MLGQVGFKLRTRVPQILDLDWISTIGLTLNVSLQRQHSVQWELGIQNLVLDGS